MLSVVEASTACACCGCRIALPFPNSKECSACNVLRVLDTSVGDRVVAMSDNDVSRMRDALLDDLIKDGGDGARVQQRFRHLWPSVASEEMTMTKIFTEVRQDPDNPDWPHIAIWFGNKIGPPDGRLVFDEPGPGRRTKLSLAIELAAKLASK